MRRLLLRLRRQVPARLDGGDGRRAVTELARRRLRARRPRLPGRHRQRVSSATSRSTSLRARISAARVNLCITRRSHATVYASSSCRPFELAAAGAAIVSNPYNGIERWFEPGPSCSSSNDAAEAVAAYREPARRPRPGRGDRPRARERVLDEHTYRHRARRLFELVGVGGARREEDRDRPRVQRGGRDRPGDRRAARFRSRLDVSSSTTPRTTRRQIARARTVRTCRRPPVQPRDRRRRADGLPLRGRAAATTSPSGSTATGSTTRPSSAAARCGRRRRRGRHLRRLALCRRGRLPLVGRRGGSASASSPGPSRCSPASGSPIRRAGSRC